MSGLIEAEFLTLNSALNSLIVDLLYELGFAAWEEETTAGKRLKIIYSSAQTKGLEKALKNLQKMSGWKLKLLSEKTVKNDYYLKHWAAYLKPLSVGEKIRIIPLTDDIAKLRPSSGAKKSIYIKPGLAFGTGSHPSTFLALELLEKYLQPRARVLDVGTGSGVLIIAAKKLGAGKSVAVDCDRQALENAVYNSKLNQVEKIFFYELPISQWKDYAFDLVLANLTTEEIIKNFSIWQKFHSTSFIFSGILRSEVNMVEDLLCRLKFVKLEKKEKKDWAALVYKIN